MAGQSSSQAASPFQWWKPALFFLVVIVGLWYVKWQPYYGKAFTAAETHSIGKSILAQADANPLMAAWDYAMVYFLAVWKAAVLGVLLGSLIQVLIPRDWLLRTLDNRGFRARCWERFLAARHDVHLLRRAGRGRDAQTAGVDGRGAGVLDGEPATQSGDAGVYGFCSGLAVCAGSPGGGSGDSINCGDAGAEMGEEAATQPVAVPAAPSEATQGGFFSRWLQALWTLFWNTIPVYILAVLVLGAARVWLFPHADGVVDNTLFWVIAMAIAGCLFVIPTAAEIPIVQTMMLAGMGTAPALALLITLPAVSVPSLIMLRKAFPAKALWLTGGLVALCGAIVGALALV